MFLLAGPWPTSVTAVHAAGAIPPDADAAPAVVATDPADGAAGVAPGGSVTITYDEPVSVADGWFTIECATSGAHAATVSGGPTSFVLDPADDFVPGEECRVTVAGAADHTFSFTIQDPVPAEPPVANDDTASTDEDRPARIPVTANDTDGDGDLVPESVQIVVPPGAGGATVAPDGTIRYAPDPNFHGRDRFDYQVCDTGGRCDQARVAITVDAVGDRPVANDDAASTDEDAPIRVRVIANDTDGDGDVESVVVVDRPAHGRAVVVGRSIRYTPDADFHGRDRFVYRVCDARGRCDRAWVTVAVASVGDRPVANDDVASTDEDAPIRVRVIANDTDGDGDVESVVVVGRPAHGRAVVVGRSIRYTPDADFHGRDRFVYRVCDARGRCDRAWVTVAVASVGDRPVVNDDVASTDEDTPIRVRVAANDTDGDGDVESVVVVGRPAHGRAVVVGRSIRYTPDADFHGRDRFDYRVCDVTSDCVTATVTVMIRPVNDAPTAASDVVTVVWAGRVPIDVVANDTDVDGGSDLDPTSMRIVAPPFRGTASVNFATGRIEYVASPGADGIDRLTYRVCDRGGRCASATLELHLDVPETPTPVTPPPPGTLPATGSGLGSQATVPAVIVLATGVLLLVASRRRPRRAHT